MYIMIVLTYLPTSLCLPMHMCIYIYICICMNMFYIPMLKSCLPIYLYVYHNEIRKGGPTPVISRVITPIIGLGLTNR